MFNFGGFQVSYLVLHHVEDVFVRPRAEKDCTVQFLNVICAVFNANLLFLEVFVCFVYCGGQWFEELGADVFHARFYIKPV